MVWLIIMVVAAIGLVWSFFIGPNAIWGGAALGLLVGLVWGLVVGEGVALVLRGAAVGAVVGFAAELLGRLSNRRR